MPTSFTIHNLEDEVVAQLEAEAARRGVDRSSLARDLLIKALEVTGKAGVPQRQRSLEQLAGTWSADEAAEFLAAMSDFESIDEGLWR